jgi:hypothetical protein
MGIVSRRAGGLGMLETVEDDMIQVILEVVWYFRDGKQ